MTEAQYLAQQAALEAAATAPPLTPEQIVWGVMVLGLAIVALVVASIE